MTKFVLGRLAQAVLTLAAASVIVFFVGRLTGSPEDVMLTPDATLEDIAAFRQAYGLDRPLLDQYVAWAGKAIRGDLGTGTHYAVPVSELIAQRLRTSLPLATIAYAMALVVAIPLGVLAAIRRGRPPDRIATVVAAGGQAVPPYWLGMMLVFLFAVNLRVLPAAGAGTWTAYVLPGVTLGYFLTAGVMRFIRSGMLDTLDSEYVKFARLKGLPERTVILKHALRNALIPTVTFVGYMFGSTLMAAITVEVVFNWPGVGNLLYNAISFRDFPVVQGIVLACVFVNISLNTLTDIAYAGLDPRVRVMT